MMYDFIFATEEEEGDSNSKWYSLTRHISGSLLNRESFGRVKTIWLQITRMLKKTIFYSENMNSVTSLEDIQDSKLPH